MPQRTLSRSLLALAVALQWTASVLAVDNPSLLLNSADFERLRHSNLPHQQAAVNSTVNQATDLLAQQIAVPAEGGGWIFELYCPRHDALLRRLDYRKFQCPVDAEIFEGEKYEASYRTTLHDHAASACETLGLAYQFTGDERFAQKAAEILLKYADQYGGYVRHDRWGRTGVAAFMGGKRYAQALDEAVNLIPCSWAYDLIAHSKALSNEQRTHIERDFLRAAVRELEVPTFQQDNNHQTWINAGIASVGFCLGDQRLIEESLRGPHGFYYQMGKLVTADGLWIEGTMAYQNYAMQPLTMHAEMARKAGIDIASEPHLRLLFDGPIAAAFPDGTFPIINDSDPYHLSSFADLYEWAYAAYGEPRYGAVAALGQRGGRWAWMVGAASLPTADVVPQTSRNLSGIGYLYLQRKRGADASCAVLDYGPHGGGHGHPDKLNLILFALGRVLFVDPGRISYSVPEYQSWCKQTVAHNTVVIDGRSQQATTGECLWFVGGPDFDAACVRSTGAYPDADLRRVVAITDDYILDAYQVEAGRAHQIDWLLHVSGAPQPAAGFAPYAQPLGAEEGYQHLADLQRRETGGAASLDWKLDQQNTLRLHTTAPNPEQWFTGYGIGTRLGERVPFLMRRVRARSATFACAYEIAGAGGPKITSIRCRRTGWRQPRLVIQVRSPQWTDSWTLPLSPSPKPPGRAPAPLPELKALSFRRAAAR